MNKSFFKYSFRVLHFFDFSIGVDLYNLRMWKAGRDTNIPLNQSPKNFFEPLFIILFLRYIVVLNYLRIGDSDEIVMRVHALQCVQRNKLSQEDINKNRKKSNNKGFQSFFGS
jgi:hypothetical protein